MYTVFYCKVQSGNPRWNTFIRPKMGQEIISSLVVTHHKNLPAPDNDGCIICNEFTTEK